jgi:hypothetical protein
MLRVIRPEAGEEPAGFFDLLRVIRLEGGHRPPSRRRVLMNPPSSKETKGYSLVVGF